MSLKLIIMKNILYSFFILLLSIHSNAQKKIVHKIPSSKSMTMMIPNITKNDIKIPNLDDLIATENKKIFGRTKDSLQLLKKSARELTFEENGFISLYREGKLVMLTKMMKDTIQKPIPVKQMFSEWRDEYKQSTETVVNFYPDGKVHVIKHFNITTNGQYPAGNWYVYSPDGKLSGHIDHEKYFKLSYYDLAMIADTYDYPSITILRDFNRKGFAYWTIILAGFQDWRKKTKILIIGDKTKKILYDLNQDEYQDFLKFNKMMKYNEDFYAPFKIHLLSKYK